MASILKILWHRIFSFCTEMEGISHGTHNQSFLFIKFTIKCESCDSSAILHKFDRLKFAFYAHFKLNAVEVLFHNCTTFWWWFQHNYQLHLLPSLSSVYDLRLRQKLLAWPLFICQSSVNERLICWEQGKSKKGVLEDPNQPQQTNAINVDDKDEDRLSWLAPLLPLRH